MSGAPSTVLLIEDDDGDALLVSESLKEIGIREAAIIWRRSAAAGVSALEVLDVSCVLLDLGLPDAQGLEAVHTVAAAASKVPVVVLTGRNDRLGTDAVAAGAQDYLVKDDISPEVLDRTIRYAVERHQAKAVELQLSEQRVLAAENARLERGLLPRPLLRSDDVICASHYRPGRSQAVLGGDFFDVVESRDGRVRAVIGDVMGHGPDEAAIGVAVRVAWRTLVLSGVDDEDLLGHLSRLLAAEAGQDIFVTVLDLTIEPDLRMSVRIAGHPPPMVRSEGVLRHLEAEIGPPLGVELAARPGSEQFMWPVTHTRLAPGSSVVMFTDGLLDAYRSETGTGLGLDELLEATRTALASGLPLEQLPENIVARSPLRPADDTAVVALRVGAPR